MSNSLVCPLLAIITLFLLYFIKWGWTLRSYGHVNDNAVFSNWLCFQKKEKSSWLEMGWLWLIFVKTMLFVIGFDLLYVKYVATNPTLGTEYKALANTGMALFKSTLLNEQKISMDTMAVFKPKERFKFLTSVMSTIMLLNGLVVPCILDERCFKFSGSNPFGNTQAPREADVFVTFCGYADTHGYYNCPIYDDPRYPNDGYITLEYATIFDYPFTLSDQCGSAMI